MLEGHFDVPFAESPEDFARQFQAFIGGYRDQVQTVLRQPFGSTTLEEKLERLLQTGLSDWEHSFVRSVRGQLLDGKRLTEKQRGVIDSLLERIPVLKGGRR